MKRGDLYWAVLAPRSGSEQQGRRPVIVVSHDGFNQTAQLAFSDSRTGFYFAETGRTRTHCCTAAERQCRTEEGKRCVVPSGYDLGSRQAHCADWYSRADRDARCGSGTKSRS